MNSEGDNTEDDIATRSRSSLVSLVRAIPIRWRILSIAALNSAVVLVLAALIWNGARVLSSAWDEVRQVRESDRLLAMLESEASRLQNLIHRYINQPNPEMFAEILLLREAVLGTLQHPRLDRSDARRLGRRSSSASPSDSSTASASCAACRPRSPRPTRTRCSSPPAKWAGSTPSSRAPASATALIWPALGKSREAFTAMLVAANAYYLSLSTRVRRRGEPQRRHHREDHSGDDRPRRQRPADARAAARSSQRAAALRQGLAALAEQFAARNKLLRTAIDGNQAAMIAAIDGLSVKMRAARAAGAGQVRPDARRHLRPGRHHRAACSSP